MFGSSWLVILFMTNSPFYLKEVLKFDIQSNSLLSIPYLAIFLVIMLSSFLSDLLAKRYNVKIKTIRRLFNIVGNLKNLL
jgi:ACS family sodium-dependent inorganic phosphate cotransporter-like MFS transporter 5